MATHGLRWHKATTFAYVSTEYVSYNTTVKNVTFQQYLTCGNQVAMQPFNLIICKTCPCIGKKLLTIIKMKSHRHISHQPFTVRRRPSSIHDTQLDQQPFSSSHRQQRSPGRPSNDPLGVLLYVLRLLFHLFICYFLRVTAVARQSTSTTECPLWSECPPSFLDGGATPGDQLVSTSHNM